MYSEKQRRILEDLDRYISETPREKKEEDVAAISALKFAGVSADTYFEHFGEYFGGRATGTSTMFFSGIDVG